MAKQRQPAWYAEIMYNNVSPMRQWHVIGLKWSSDCMSRFPQITHNSCFKSITMFRISHYCYQWKKHGTSVIEYPRNIPWNIEVRVFGSRFPGFWLANHVTGGILWNFTEYCGILRNMVEYCGISHEIRHLFMILRHPTSSDIPQYSAIFHYIPQYSMEYLYSTEI